ncbi:375_t:CDS:2 [Funneliformis mosseae]|uniref:375_t:CDS:1 n=1 Tax=Funneliformis mosseae TaxID=27381 RepID=A0A9N9EUF1_FUNMO|nr:375_t:CDS:2 [Funneliformis mosseae]
MCISLCLNYLKYSPFLLFDELAYALISRLDRSKIFPPTYHTRPEDFICVETQHAQQRFYVKGTCFFFCCQNVKEAANVLGNQTHMRIIFKAAGIYWSAASNEEKDVYKNLYNATQNLCLRRNNNTIVQQFSHPPTPNPVYETMSNQFNNGILFDTFEPNFNVW